MSKQCVKCGYVRQASDTAPDYECPKCGVIYSKVERLTKQPLEVPENWVQAEAVDAPKSMFAKRGSVLMAALFVLVMMLAGFFYFKARSTENAAQQTAKIKQQLEAQKLQEEASAVGQLLKRKALAEQQAKAAIANVMKDPTSIQYQGVSVALDMPVRLVRENSPQELVADFVCGEYNAKNSYGGYTGFKWFYWDTEKRELVMNTLGSGDFFGEVEEKKARMGCQVIQLQSLSKS